MVVFFSGTIPQVMHQISEIQLSLPPCTDTFSLASVLQVTALPSFQLLQHVT